MHRFPLALLLVVPLAAASAPAPAGAAYVALMPAATGTRTITLPPPLFPPPPTVSAGLGPLGGDPRTFLTNDAVLKFDLSPVQGTITSAVLALYIVTAGNPPFSPPPFIGLGVGGFASNVAPVTLADFDRSASLGSIFLPGSVPPGSGFAVNLDVTAFVRSLQATAGGFQLNDLTAGTSIVLGGSGIGGPAPSLIIDYIPSSTPTVPEPASSVLLGIGSTAVALGLRRRSRR